MSKKIQVTIQDEQQVGNNKIIKATIGNKIICLYLLKNNNKAEYSVLNISEKKYNEVLQGQHFNGLGEELFGTMNIGQDVAQWIETKQKNEKAFGDIKNGRKIWARLILCMIPLLGIILTGIGLWRIQYKRAVEKRAITTEGEVVRYTTAHINGTHTEGYYKVYVEYYVDGKRYEGYNGTTATKRATGAKVTVKYDPENPGYIYVSEDMFEDTFMFFLLGGGLLLFSCVLFITYIGKVIDVKKEKDRVNRIRDNVIETNSITYTSHRNKYENILNTKIGSNRFDELVVSYPAQCGYGIKGEFAAKYYYAYIILSIDDEQVPICRYVEISEEEYEQCLMKYPQSQETDMISSQAFYGEFIYGKKILYEGKYNSDILQHSMSEINEYFGETEKSTSLEKSEIAWGKLCKKMFRSCVILTIISTVWFIAMTILRIMIKDLDFVYPIWMFSLAFITGSSVAIIYMLTEKNLFLKNEDVALYTDQILYNVIRHTPTAVITSRYIFNRMNISRPIDLSRVQWVYSKRIGAGNNSTNVIVMRMLDGKKREMNYMQSFTESNLYHLIKPYNPNVQIGWSVKNEKDYKEIVKANSIK